MSFIPPSVVSAPEDNQTSDGALPAYEPDGELPPDSYRAQADAEASARRARGRHLLREIVQTIILASLIFFAVRALAQNFRVEGSSMEPGLHDGQYVLVNKAIFFKLNPGSLARYIPFVDAEDEDRFLFRAPERGDVVVFRFPQDPSRDFIKRVIGVPGDTIEIVEGAVFVNGVRIQEPYITNRAQYDFARQTVPNGNYFVLGDNRSFSSDSHVWGFVPESDIIGQAMVRYWPLSAFGGVGNHSINLGIIRIPLP
jgi:signal peptidase I